LAFLRNEADVEVPCDVRRPVSLNVIALSGAAGGAKAVGVAGALGRGDTNPWAGCTGVVLNKRGKIKSAIAATPIPPTHLHRPGVMRGGTSVSIRL
jgi:hypothetical protein